MDGLSVLDLGAWDGFFSFECERRGAKRVAAVEWYSWQGELKTGFLIAKEALRSNVEEVLCKIEDLTPAALGTFDIVLFLGILYHAEDPMRYLRIVRALCKGLAVVETHVDALDYPRPAMVFYPGKILSNDPTNFWGPNRLAVEAMLVEVGFRTAEWVATYDGCRMVFHAYV